MPQVSALARVSNGKAGVCLNLQGSREDLQRDSGARVADPSSCRPGGRARLGVHFSGGKTEAQGDHQLEGEADLSCANREVRARLVGVLGTGSP